MSSTLDWHHIAEAARGRRALSADDRAGLVRDIDGIGPEYGPPDELRALSDVDLSKRFLCAMQDYLAGYA